MTKKIYRSDSNKMIAGVLGGLGEYYGIDPTILRLIFVLLLFPTGGSLLIVYLLAIIIMPKQNSISKKNRIV